MPNTNIFLLCMTSLTYLCSESLCHLFKLSLLMEFERSFWTNRTLATEEIKQVNKKLHQNNYIYQNNLYLFSKSLFFCWPHGRRRKEGNVLFNDTLNTFYLRLYGIRHMVKDHSDCERGNPLLPHGLLFPISSKGSFIFYMHHPIDRIAHTTAFVIPVVEQWPIREIALALGFHRNNCFR